MPTITPLAEGWRGRSGTSHRAARHHLSPSPYRTRSAIGSRSFPTISSRWARRPRRCGRVRPIAKRVLLFELDRCRRDAVSFDGDGSGHDDTVVAPQTLILILRYVPEIDVDALAVVGGDHQRLSRDPQ